MTVRFVSVVWQFLDDFDCFCGIILIYVPLYKTVYYVIPRRQIICDCIKQAVKIMFM